MQNTTVTRAMALTVFRFIFLFILYALPYFKRSIRSTNGINIMLYTSAS